MSEIQSSDIKTFVSDLVRLGGIYTVDSEGYITNKVNPDEPVIYKSGTQLKRILVLQDVIKDNDALILNPLSENALESADSQWLYKMLSVGLSRRVITIFKFIHRSLKAEKNKQEEDALDLSSEAMAFLSRHKDFDDAVMDHFTLITEKKLEFMNVFYDRKLKESKFRCSIYDPDTKVKYPKVKAWKIITSISNELFNLNAENPVESLKTDYVVSSDLITVPKLESMLKLYMKLYTRLNRYLVMLDVVEDEDLIVDITTLGHHIEHLEDYYKKAKWFTSSAPSVPSRPTLKVAESGIQAVESSIPTNPALHQVGHVPGIYGGYQEPESGIPSNPNRHGAIEYAGYHQQQVMQVPIMQGSIPIGGGIALRGPGGGIPIGNQTGMGIPIGGQPMGYAVRRY